MTDGGRRYSRRRDDEPITVGELSRRMDRHETASELLHRDQLAMIRRLDERIEALDARTDAIATRVTVVFSVVAVLWALFLVIAPMIRVFLGVTGSTGG